MENVIRAKSPARLPVVLTTDEVRAILPRLDCQHWLMASLLYGSGLRLFECVRLRIKDIDFEYGQIMVRDGKGNKDRVTMLPRGLIAPLRAHLKKAKDLHNQDLALAVRVSRTRAIRRPALREAAVPLCG